MSQVGLPENWERTQLRDVCAGEPQNGAFIKNPDFGAGLRFVNVKDIYRGVIVDLDSVERLQCDEASSKRYALREDDLLFVRSSLKREGIGQCCVVKGIQEPAIYDCHLIRVSPDKDKVDALFLGYYFLSSRGKEDLIARSKTTTMTTINQKTLAESEIVVPPIPEQRAIARALRAVQEAREARLKELQLERERKATLMQHLFTHGTRGEARKQTEIGEMPESWIIVRLYEVFETQLGKMLSQKARVGDSPKPYMRNANVQWGQVDCTDVQTMDFNEAEAEKFRLKNGDLLVCEGGEVGRTAIWRDEIAECYFQKAIHRLRPHSNELMPEFFLYWMERAFRFGNIYGVAGTQTTIAHLPQEKLKAMKIPKPLLQDQEQIVVLMKACDSKIAALEKESSLLNELFRAMLEELMTGRLSAQPLIEF